VFFILTTIGLGVAVYFGFAEQEKKDQEVKTAKKDADVFKKERDWYKFQSSMYLSYMGQGKAVEGAENLGTSKTQFDQGTLKGGKDNETVTKILKDLDKRYGWNGNQPKATFEDEIEKGKKDYEALAKKNQDLAKEVADTKDKLTKAEDGLKAAQTDYTAKLDELKKKSVEEKNDFEKALKDLRESVAQLSADHTKKLLAAEKERTGLGTQLKKKDEDIKNLALRVKDQQERLEEHQRQSTEAPASMRTDWKIVSMDRRGTNPYINLGSADKVKPQLTFTIHGVGLDGRPNPQPKGTLEVVNVIRDHLSQAHITSVKDANRDPILKGDILYNPSWNPTIKKHVALAGIMDITGDGRDSLYEFMRNLQRQNIVVDAYMDPKDGSIKGEITLRTDYLILGESQEFSPTGREKAGGEAQKKLDEGKKAMEAEATKKNVAKMPLHKYLEMIGYRLPRSVNEERPSLFNPNLRPDLAPRLGGEKPPAMKPDK
jgi:hypothetical protein